MNKIPQTIRDRNIDPYDGASKPPSVWPQGRRGGHTLRSQGRRETLMRPSVLLTTEMMGASHSNSIMLARLASLTVPQGPASREYRSNPTLREHRTNPFGFVQSKTSYLAYFFSPSKFSLGENFPVCRRNVIKEMSKYVTSGKLLRDRTSS